MWNDRIALLVIARTLTGDDTASGMVDVHVVRTVTARNELVGVIRSPASARQQLQILARPDRTGIVGPALTAAAPEPDRV